MSCANDATTATAQPGWYVDPSAATRQRYWDGSAWTSHVAGLFTNQPGAHVSVVTGMSFPQAVRSVLTKYVGFSGRARRSEYWWFSLFTNIVAVVVAFCAIFVAIVTTSLAAGPATSDAQVTPGIAPFLAMGITDLVLLTMFLPALAVAVRRLHDTNRSGWFYLISLVPIVGGIVLLVFMCEDSGRGPNRYGSSPKYV